MTTNPGTNTAHAESPVRERLAAAALTLFNGRGYAATSVREIVEAAGVTKPVLYYHFQNKEGIYLHLMRSAFDEALPAVEAIAAAPGSAVVRLRRLLAELYRLFLVNESKVRLMYAIYYGPPQGAPHVDFDEFHLAIEAVVRRIADEGVRAGEFVERDRDLMALAAMSCLDTAMQMKLCTPERPCGIEGLHRLFDIVVAGFSHPTPAGGSDTHESVNERVSR
jgi:AcrR family transcriptional regulator